MESEENRYICFASNSVRHEFQSAFSDDVAKVTKKILKRFPYGAHTYIYPSVLFKSKEPRMRVVFESLEECILIHRVERDIEKHDWIRKVWPWVRAALVVLGLAQEH